MGALVGQVCARWLEEEPGWEVVCKGEGLKWVELLEAVRRRKIPEECWELVGGCLVVEVDSCWEDCRWEMGDC